MMVGAITMSPPPPPPSQDASKLPKSKDLPDVEITPPPPPPTVIGHPPTLSSTEKPMAPSQSRSSPQDETCTQHTSDQSLSLVSDSHQRLFWQHASPPALASLYSASSKKGMFLSSVSHWNDNPMLNIPQQSFQVPEPPYKLAMDGRMPPFATDCDNIHAFSSPSELNSLGFPLTGIFPTTHAGLTQNVSPKVNSSTAFSMGITDRSDNLLSDFSLPMKL